MDPFSSVAGLLGMTQGDKSSATVQPISSGISGATSFSGGDFVVNKGSNSTVYIIAGIAVLALLILVRKS